MIHEVFPGRLASERLPARLAEARQAGADLAVLPELPLDSWVPSTDQPRETDVEDSDGPRHRSLANAARHAGIAVIGGAIVRDSETGQRRNRALVYDGSGRLLGSYDKLHVPSEEGFWEAAHYSEGLHSPTPIEGLALPFGIQICSDLFRPAGCQLLGAQGAMAIFAPRATPLSSYTRWLGIIRSNAITSGAYVLSVNRPAPEGDARIGGPSVAVGPDGEPLVESTEPVTVVTLERTAVERARREYPGYLRVRASVYADAWSRIPDSGGAPE
jgi:predicted amidohydrolase